jgi:hypothetical protein
MPEMLKMKVLWGGYIRRKVCYIYESTQREIFGVLPQTFSERFISVLLCR